MPRTASTTDRALSEALARRGTTAPPRKLEAMRQAGMLQERTRVGQGRGLGSRAIPAEDELDRAQYMVRLLEECGSYADAVLTAFVQAPYPIAKDRLGHAYEQSIGAQLKKLARPGQSTALDTALSSASKLVRYLTKERAFGPFRQRARYLGLVHANAPMHRVMFDLATDLIVLMIADDDCPLATRAAEKLETLAGDGIIEAPTPSPSPRAPGALPFRELIRRVPLAALPRLVRSATIAELTRARDSAKALRSFAREFAPQAELRAGSGRAFPWIVVAAGNDRAVAYSIPAFVLLHRIYGAKFDATISFFEEWTLYFRAANLLISELPAHLQVIARPDGYDSLTPGEKHELSQRIQRLETTHRSEMALLQNPPAIAETVG